MVLMGDKAIFCGTAVEVTRSQNISSEEKAKLFNTDAANAREQIKTLLVNFGLTVKELKKQLLLSALTEFL